MTHGSLFSGIGGFDLAAEWMGWDNVFHCEIEPFNQKILKYYWPKATSYADIKKTDFTIHRGTIDILTGGDPCQPHSIAGKRAGKEDERYLWPEMLRCYVETGAKYLVNENVVGTIPNGVFDTKTRDLEANGYAWEAFTLPARAFGAQHERYRVFLVSYPKCEGLQRHNTFRKDIRIHQEQAQPFYSDTDVFKRGDLVKGYSQYIRSSDGVSRKLDKHRVKALGNAIVPQVAYEIFKAIEAYEQLKTTNNEPL